MKIPEILTSLLLLVTQFFDDETMKEDRFFQEFSAKLQEICRLAREQNMDSVHLISLLTPFLELLTTHVSPSRYFRILFLKVLNESFSSVHLTFSWKNNDEGYVLIVEQTPIKLSIARSIMYQTNEPTNCLTFLTNIVRYYQWSTTPVVQFGILSSGIFKDIFLTFGDLLASFHLPPKVPEGHPHPFIFIENYVSYYKFDLFDQIFTILNKSVSELRLTSNDFHQILRLLKDAQNTSDEKTFAEYPRDRWTTFFFISALIGFQLRDMLSSAEDKRMITEVLRIKENDVLQRKVKAEIRMYYSSRISSDFFKNPKNSAEVDFTYLKHMITDLITEFEDDPTKYLKANDALIKFYDGLK
jgi:hypothetical protein